MRFRFQSEFLFPKSVRLLLRHLLTKWLLAVLIITSFAGANFLTISTAKHAQQPDAWKMGPASRVQTLSGLSKINGEPRTANWSSDQSLRRPGVSTAEAPNAN